MDPQQSWHCAFGDVPWASGQALVAQGTEASFATNLLRGKGDRGDRKLLTMVFLGRVKVLKVPGAKSPDCFPPKDGQATQLTWCTAVINACPAEAFKQTLQMHRQSALKMIKVPQAVRRYSPASICCIQASLSCKTVTLKLSKGVTRADRA